jgi:ketopantoate reductase
MRRRFGMQLLLVFVTALATTAMLAADDPKQRQDLFTVITLNGMPCGEVVSYVVKGDNDYVASCKDGNRYRVYVNSEGRVVVQKQ